MDSKVIYNAAGVHLLHHLLHTHQSCFKNEQSFMTLWVIEFFFF